MYPALRGSSQLINLADIYWAGSQLPETNKDPVGTKRSYSMSVLGKHCSKNPTCMRTACQVSPNIGKYKKIPIYTGKYRKGPKYTKLYEK